MRGIDCNERTKRAGTGRNAGIRRRQRILAGVLASTPVFSACLAPRPEFLPPRPRVGVDEPRTLVTDRARPIEHRSESVIRGEVRFLDGSGDDPDLGPVVVYLVPGITGTESPATEPAPPLVLTSTTPEFAPHFAAVAAGQKLVLANEGPLSHGLFSADVGTARFDLPPGTRSLPFAVPPRGPIRFYCALHSEETFVVFASTARHLAVVETGESYRFESVDAGRYTLTIWSRLVEGPVREVFADGYTSPVEMVWIDPDLLRRPIDPQDRP